jgi:hypothetical protein
VRSLRPATRHADPRRSLPDGRWFDPTQQTWRDRRGRGARWPDLLAMIPARTTRVVLATAHLDHDPSHNRLRNLKSLCQRCHLLHDRPYHRAQRWITFRRRHATGDLFLGFYTPSHVDSDAAETAHVTETVVSPFSVMRAFRPRQSAADDQSTKFANSTRSSKTQSASRIFGPVELLI